jgi:hypothetical protein
MLFSVLSFIFGQVVRPGKNETMARKEALCAGTAGSFHIPAVGWNPPGTASSVINGMKR